VIAAIAGCRDRRRYHAEIANVVVDAIERRGLSARELCSTDPENLAIFSAKFVLTFAVHRASGFARYAGAMGSRPFSGISAGYFCRMVDVAAGGDFSKAMKSGLSRAPS